MDHDDSVMAVRIAVVVAAGLAAFFWRELGDDVKMLAKVVGVIFLLSLPIGVFRYNEWFIIGWITFCFGAFATVLSRKDGAPWINYANAPFFAVSGVTLALAARAAS